MCYCTEKRIGSSLSHSNTQNHTVPDCVGASREMRRHTVKPMLRPAPPRPAAPTTTSHPYPAQTRGRLRRLRRRLRRQRRLARSTARRKTKPDRRSGLVLRLAVEAAVSNGGSHTPLTRHCKSQIPTTNQFILKDPIRAIAEALDSKTLSSCQFKSFPSPILSSIPNCRDTSNYTTQ